MTINPMKFKIGLAIAKIAVGIGLNKVPKIKEIGAVKRFARKSIDYGMSEGEEVIRKVAYDISPDIINVFEVILDDDVPISPATFNEDNEIKVVFLDDDDDILLLPAHKENP